MAQIFPKKMNKLPLQILVGLGVGLLAVTGIIWYYFSPSFTDVGYQPKQPVPFSHRAHAGERGLDCRYCHSTVEDAPFASLPPNETCMNCHANLDLGEKTARIQPLLDSVEGDSTLEWVRVHMLPNYAYFDHSAHLNAGVGCSSCHGRVDQMDVVYQAEPLSMGWCLDCHRNPEPHLRPQSEITNMAWTGEGYDPASDPHRKRKFSASVVKPGAKIPADHINPPIQNCSGCHR